MFISIGELGFDSEVLVGVFVVVEACIFWKETQAKGGEMEKWQEDVFTLSCFFFFFLKEKSVSYLRINDPAQFFRPCIWVVNLQMDFFFFFGTV